MADEKGYHGWTNYATYCIYLWLTNEDESYKYWTRRAQELLDDEQEHPAEHLRDALQDQISAKMPKLEGMWSDLLIHTLGEVNWQEIAEALLEDKKKEND
jgi:hypothetical protein